jgi:hypothetical protein
MMKKSITDNKHQSSNAKVSPQIKTETEREHNRCNGGRFETNTNRLIC